MVMPIIVFLSNYEIKSIKILFASNGIFEEYMSSAEADQHRESDGLTTKKKKSDPYITQI